MRLEFQQEPCTLSLLMVYGSPRKINEHPSLTDPDSARSELIRVEYDVAKAAQAIEASPLPNEYADMLRRAC